MQFNNTSFKEIPGFNGKYFISKNGDILSLVSGRPKLKKTIKSRTGYILVSLVIECGKQKQFPIHRLLVKTYILESDKWPKGKVTDHINGNKTDNRLENLELVTNQENLRRAFALGGYINRYTPVKARNWETKETIVFESCNACERHVGLWKDAIKKTGRLNSPNTVFAEGWQYCNPDQEFPDDNLIFLNEIEKPISVKDLSTSLEYDFDTLTEAAKFLNLGISTLSVWLSKEEQPFTPSMCLVKYRDNPNPWRLVMDPMLELIDKNKDIEPVFVYNDDDIMFFLSVNDAGRFFNCGVTTVAYRCKNRTRKNGYNYIYYKDWVVLKPFELRGPLAKYFVPTQGSDILGGSSNQAETVKSKVIEKIRSQDSAFEQITITKVKSVIRRKLRQLFNRLDKDRLPDYWKDIDVFTQEITQLPGYNERDFYFGRIKLKLNVKRDGRVFNEFHSRENSVFVKVPEYIVE